MEYSTWAEHQIADKDENKTVWKISTGNGGSLKGLKKIIYARLIF